MFESHVLIEAKGTYGEKAHDLLVAADMKPVRATRKGHNASNILHQITVPDTLKGYGAVEEMVRQVVTEVEETRSRHEGREIVFCMPQASEDMFVRVIAGMKTRRPEDLELANTIPDAVARIIFRAATKDQAPRAAMAPTGFALDAVPGMDAAGDDLRDDETGRLDAKKIGELFGLKMAGMAEAAGISKQGLDQNPDSEKAQPVLRHFERIARLRTHPQFRDPATLRKWFRKPLPLFSNHSAEELFKAGKLEVVATKVDQMLTGDFGG